eukprot:CAMPEP_0197005254 /NCGR_PEP_ID=MMETSP1380-20130617/28662_1 /TAXON_ID=5936 /ORGANISM="Euplotes crassus, Strain CT5" /LENGTH=418 /DNA_ID=CAMNT_0042424331 /DNA_START=109 /DNA_END=1366 /DNA_ORIENTATION=+
MNSSYDSSDKDDRKTSKKRKDDTLDHSKLDKEMSRVAKTRAGKEEDAKDKVLGKLRAINFRLRKKLKYLNEKVEKAIDRTETKRILAARKRAPKDTAHMIRVKDKEIDNAQNQIESYQVEIHKLQTKIDEISQVGKMIEIEQEVREHKSIVSELKKEIKDKELLLKNLAKSDDPSYKIKNMINEIRMWKEKIAARQELYEKNENNVNGQSERLPEIEKENEELMGQIQSLDAKIDLENSKKKDKRAKKDLEDIGENVKTSKEKFEMGKKNHEKEIKAQKKKTDEAEKEREELYKKLKELGQEKRISSLKLREVGRMLKHNQLNPIGAVNTKNVMTSRRGESVKKKVLNKRGSTSNLHSGSKPRRRSIVSGEKKLSKGKNNQSTQLLHKQKQYSKPNEDSDEDFEKNQVLDYSKLKKRV